MRSCNTVIIAVYIIFLVNALQLVNVILKSRSMVLVDWVKQTIFIIGEIFESAWSSLKIKKFCSSNFSTPAFKSGANLSVLRIVYLCAVIAWFKGYEAISDIEEAFATNKYVFFCIVAFLGAYQDRGIVKIYQCVVFKRGVQCEDNNKNN